LSKLPKQPNSAAPQGSRPSSSSRASTRGQHADAPVKDDFVPVTGVVHHQTSLGLSLEVVRRRVFVPINCMLSPSAVFEAGEPAALMVFRSFAEQEGLIPLAASQAPRPFPREASKPGYNPTQISEQKAKPRSRWRLRDRLVAMCVVETTAAMQSGMSSWKTKPCRLLLRLLMGVPRRGAK
jgi:hypothetical protein